MAKCVAMGSWQQVSARIGAVLGSRPSPPHLGLRREKLEYGSRLTARKIIANNTTRSLFLPFLLETE